MWLLTKVILIPYSIVSLQLIVALLLIIALVQLSDMTFSKWLPKIHEKLGPYLPILMSNCAVLAVALTASGENPHSGQFYSLVEAVVYGVSSGIGYTVVLVLMAALKEKLSFSSGFESLRGLPIALITAGLVAMAFLGFVGMHFPSLGKGF
jgi:electron transport complex protein RnfA